MSARVRGCGSRVKGGIYAEVPLSPKGRPIENFLVCPPRPIDPQATGVTPMGVTLVEDAGNDTHHVFDWVGSEHYPNVLDIIEEGRRLGFSRRLARNLDFGKLNERSKLVLIHSRAILDNPASYREAIRAEIKDYKDVDGMVHALTPRIADCPAKISRHIALVLDDAANGQMCGSLWREDVIFGEPVLDPTVAPRTVERTVGCVTYRARQRAEGVDTAASVGIFAVLPIGHLTVIRDPEGNTHELAAEAAGKANLDVHFDDS